MKKILAFYYS